jgi:hypothetical protein
VLRLGELEAAAGRRRCEEVADDAAAALTPARALLRLLLH